MLKRHFTSVYTNVYVGVFAHNGILKSWEQNNLRLHEISMQQYHRA